MNIFQFLLCAIVLRKCECDLKLYESKSIDIYFGKQNDNTLQLLDFSNLSSLNDIPFRKNCLTKILIHGANDNIHSLAYVKGVQAFREKKYCIDILLIDWYHYFPSLFSYLTNFNKQQTVKDAAEILYEKLKILIDRGKIELSRIHLQGHSMGAHLAGVVGYHFDGKLARITGFDPAGKFYSLSNFEIDRSELDAYCSSKLTKKSAKYVEIIHSNVRYAGTSELWAHANIFIGTGNVRQCDHLGYWKEIKCEHSIAFFIFYEAVRDPYRFPLIECGSIEQLRDYECPNRQLVLAFLGQETVNVNINSGLFLVNEKFVLDNDTKFD